MADLPSTPADGNVKIAWVPTIADPTAPTAAELVASGVVDISCYLTADGWTPGGSQATVTDDRLCDVQTYAQPGRTTRTLALRYIENPGSSTNNKAVTTLIAGTAGYFVERRGLAFDTAFAATQKVTVWPVKMGLQIPQPPAANSVLSTAQEVFPIGPVRTNVAVV